MIEKLMNPERPYGEPDYSKLTDQIDQLRCSISAQLSPQSQNEMEQLAEAYIRRETAALSDAFTDGFWAAVKLVLELYRREPTQP